MASWHIALALLAFVAPLGSSGETCVGAKPTADIYSTRNILLSRETVFIVEFSLKCNNNVKGVALYAEVNGKVMPVTVSSDDAKYQVSWAESHKEAKSGIYTLSFYDEAGYAAYRKALRSGTENEAKPLFTVDIDHKGAGREGLYVQTEFIAVVAALLIWWSANNVKSKLQES
ncbi:PREDICTED: translocon-associated protein subunit delta-like isoform X2 [Acropora digitifera]|uniref:translocon-associated protein subunit delta-like isoform X1 n=1 Tax=Acropora digitifera TaxID=70779 RepID=UPI00077A2C92|nr:PREDICTED: translocon-associated protein subunit delta-like isoform X1 [Acropora digitifera]XP_015760453.1 PREDICTED: translocon-associated protein subunit delta-like isoform X2 [Acropora digitifera]